MKIRCFCHVIQNNFLKNLKVNRMWLIFKDADIACTTANKNSSHKLIPLQI